jgi:hypothetical protein
MRDAIDFVITWVDDTDPVWLADREKYRGIPAVSGDCRFRDWGLLQFWFRGVEKFAPWVNKVHFVTYGHLPKWLNTDHPKINIVKHTDYIPEEYLPTFNSHTIELNLHRIPDLAEQFVYFNDDMFLLNAVTPEDFFKNGLPKETCGLDVPRFDSRSIAFIDSNNIALINDRFDKKQFIKQSFRKIYTPVIGRNKFIKNIFLAPFPYFTGFFNHHIACSYLRKSFETAWKLYPEQLDATCRCRLRQRTNVNQWLIKDLQFMHGWFENRSSSFGDRINVHKSNIKDCCYRIREQKLKMLCVNDNERVKQLEEMKKCLQAAFKSILPEKSFYER